jgi:hypothetical protein
MSNIAKKEFARIFDNSLKTNSDSSKTTNSCSGPAILTDGERIRLLIAALDTNQSPSSFIIARDSDGPAYAECGSTRLNLSKPR